MPYRSIPSHFEPSFLVIELWMNVVSNSLKFQKEILDYHLKLIKNLHKFLLSITLFDKALFLLAGQVQVQETPQ